MASEAWAAGGLRPQPSAASRSAASIESSTLGILLRLLDLLTVAAGPWIACFATSSPWRLHYALAGGCASTFFLIAAERRRVYRSWRLGGLAQEAGHALAAWLAAALGLVGVAYVTNTVEQVPREVVLAWALVTPFALIVWRVALRHLARAMRASGYDLRRAAVVGAGALSLRVAETIRRERWMGLQLDRVYGDDPSAFPELVRRAKDRELHVVYLALAPQAAPVKQLVRDLAQTPVAVNFVPDLSDLTLLRGRCFTFGSVPTIGLFDSPFEDFERLLKRTEDIVLSLLFLAIAALPMLLIALGVRLGSPGPAIFKQRRHGLGGREIGVWKFRTMTVCEDGAVVRQARRGDARVTRFGRLLRATSLDELPQLVNVLQGRMSLVGPRPHPLALDEAHQQRIDGYGLRQRVKPGLTGWAQVCGLRGETDTLEKMQRRVEHDLAYINCWSLGLDLKIVVLTVLRCWTGKNAY